MHARTMRWRLLALLGLPTGAACQPAEPADAPPAPVVDVLPVSTPMAVIAEDPLPTADGDGALFGACEPDHFRDWMCGSTRADAAYGSHKKSNPYATCPHTSDQVDQRQTLPHNPGPTPSMRLDAGLTEAYRAQQQDKRNNDEALPLCCFSQCVRPAIAPRSDPTPKGYVEVMRCIGAMSSTTSPAAEDDSCPAAVTFDEGPDGPHAAGFHAFQTRNYNESRATQAGMLGGMKLCCYRSIREAPSKRPVIMRGRAHRDELGVARVAAPCASERWCDAPSHHGHDAAQAQAQAQAQAWLEDAATEHASIAAFASLALDLLALGAPSDLLADAHRAAADEVRHAQLSYGFAARYSAMLRGPAPLPIAARRAAQLDEVMWSTFVDGCIGETIAALHAHEQGRLHEDPSIRDAQRIIADDEERHAALGWRIVAWALGRQPSLGRTLADALDALAAERCSDPIRAVALQHIVVPCGRALIAATAADPRGPSLPSQIGASIA